MQTTFIKTNTGYIKVDTDDSPAIKIQKIITKMLTSRKLNSKLNRDRYKEIVNLVKGKSLSIHSKIGIYSMDVITKSNKLDGENYYMISIRTNNLLFFNNNGAVSTYKINPIKSR